LNVQDILQILGGIGVIASIVYTGYQIRGNTRALRAAAYQNVSQTFISLWSSLFTDPEILDLILRSGDDFQSLTRIEKAQVRFATMTFMRTYENAYFQYKIGILQDQDWAASVGDLEGNLSRPCGPMIWQLVRGCSGADFRGVVDQIIDRLGNEAAKNQNIQPRKA
jgi:hypothetical protein